MDSNYTLNKIVTSCISHIDHVQICRYQLVLHSLGTISLQMTFSPKVKPFMLFVKHSPWCLCLRIGQISFSFFPCWLSSFILFWLLLLLFCLLLKDIWGRLVTFLLLLLPLIIVLRGPNGSLRTSSNKHVIFTTWANISLWPLVHHPILKSELQTPNKLICMRFLSTTQSCG